MKVHASDMTCSWTLAFRSPCKRRSPGCAMIHESETAMSITGRRPFMSVSGDECCGGTSNQARDAKAAMEATGV